LGKEEAYIKKKELEYVTYSTYKVAKYIVMAFNYYGLKPAELVSI